MRLFLSKFFSKNAQFATNFQKMLEMESAFFKVSILVYLTTEWQNHAQRWKPISQTKCYYINVYSGMIFFQNFPTAHKLSLTVFPVYFGNISFYTQIICKAHTWEFKYFMTLFSLNKLPHSIFIFQNNLDDIINYIATILAMQHFTKYRDLPSAPLICPCHQMYTMWVTKTETRTDICGRDLGVWEKGFLHPQDIWKKKT